MRRRRVGVFIACALAALATGSVAAASAQAEPALTLSTHSAGTLGSGAELKLSSSNFVLSGTNGSIECEENVFSGRLATNGSSTDQATIETAALQGNFNGHAGSCKNTTGKGQALLTVKSLPLPAYFTATGSFKAVPLIVTVTYPTAGPLECTFILKALQGQFSVSGPLSVHLLKTPYKLQSGNGVACSKGGDATGTFAVTSGGESVESSLGGGGSPGTVEGVIDDSASSPLANIPVSVCNYETSVCEHTETNSSGHYSVGGLAEGVYEISAEPRGGSNYGAASSERVAVAGNTVVEDFTLQEAGGVTGRVTETMGNPVSGAIVSICGEGEECYEATTNLNGEYSVSGVVDGEYEATVSAVGFGEGYSIPFKVVGTATTTVNISAPTPEVLPHGTKVEGFGEETIGGVNVPVINWGVETPMTTEACVHGTVKVKITGVNVSTGLTETSPEVTFTETPTSSGKFSGNLPRVYPIHGEGKVTIDVTNCEHSSEEGASEFTIYIDPSGTVVDGDDGNAPLAGATVTLLSAPRASGPFTAVPNGSVVMSPSNRANPSTTNAAGEFGWNTVAGHYEVRATDSGCGTTTTPSFKVPPPALNLELVLHCVLRIDTTSLPEATRGTPYEVHLAASGESPPFKWYKVGKLPKGLKLKDGVLSGTISPSKVAPGIYPVAVKVKDHAKRETTTTFMLKVN